MKTFLLHIFFFLAIFAACRLEAQTRKQIPVKANKTNEKVTPKENSTVPCGKHFVDKNGDGYNDNAPDTDGDGIPNCLDSDFKKSMMHKGKKGCQSADCAAAQEPVKANNNNRGAKRKGKQ
jgi:hypothetical protein